MAFEVLIVGLVPEKPGKTMAAIGIAAGLKKVGFNIVACKPLSIENWYLNYSATIEGINVGKPVSMDVIRFIEALDIEEPYELLNPVSNVTAPLNPEAFLEARSPTSFFTYRYDIFRQIFLSRISLPLRENKIYNMGLLNTSVLNRNFVYVPREILYGLTKRLDNLEKIPSIQAFSNTISLNAAKSIEASIHVLSKKYSIVIIEGYSDDAWPLHPNASIDIVVAVSPGKLLLYDAKKYRLAISLRSHLIPKPKSISLSDIFSLLNPMHVINFPPIPPNALPENIAEKMDEILGLLTRKIEEKTLS